MSKTLFVVALQRKGIRGRWRELKIEGGARRPVQATGRCEADLVVIEGSEQPEWIELAFGLSTSPKAGFPCIHLRIMGDRCIARADEIRLNYDINVMPETTKDGVPQAGGVIRDVVGGRHALTTWLLSEIAKAPALFPVLPARR